MSEMEAGEALVMFAQGHIKVSTAWDDNARSAPHIEIAVSGYGPLPVAGIAGLKAIAQGPLDVGAHGVLIGNFITADTAALAVPPGRYAVTVLANTVEAMTARHVHFHLSRAA